jgi:hypothetical protein
MKSMLKILKRLARPLAVRVRNFLFQYRLPVYPSICLSRYCVEQVQLLMDADGSERPSEHLYLIWKQIPGAHKWWHYFSTYECIVGPLRSRPIRLLEVGVYKGGSLAMWRRYLHPESVIVGLDIDPNCASFDRPDESIHVRIGDQSDPNFLNRIVGEFGPFDLVIDDGSHVCSHMIKTFDFLFLKGLTSNGIYVAEDTHSNFWHGYRDQQYSFIDLCKDLVDLSHAHYVKNRSDKLFTIGDPGRIRAASMTRIGAQIKEIRFLDSMVVIQRRSNPLLPTSEHL